MVPVSQNGKRKRDECDGGDIRVPVNDSAKVKKPSRGGRKSIKPKASDSGAAVSSFQADLKRTQTEGHKHATQTDYVQQFANFCKNALKQVIELNEPKEPFELYQVHGFMSELLSLLLLLMNSYYRLRKCLYYVPSLPSIVLLLEYIIYPKDKVITAGSSVVGKGLKEASLLAALSQLRNFHDNNGFYGQRNPINNKATKVCG